MREDHHDRLLAEIARHLRRQDPGFAARMSTGLSPRGPLVFIHCVGFFIPMPVVKMLFGWEGLALLAGLAGTSLLLMLARERRAANRQQD